jgi:hypothetical protein
MLTLVTTEQRVRDDHPSPRVKRRADAALKDLFPTFEKMYSRTGRLSIPPERLIKASLLMAFYTVHSEGSFASSWTTIRHHTGEELPRHIVLQQGLRPMRDERLPWTRR